MWVLLKFGVEKKHITIDLITKNQPDLVRSLGEKLKSSPTGKFIMHVVKGTANSNNLLNPSCGRAASCQGRFEWFPRRYLDMRCMFYIIISNNMPVSKGIYHNKQDPKK